MKYSVKKRRTLRCRYGFLPPQSGQKNSPPCDPYVTPRVPKMMRPSTAGNVSLLDDAAADEHRRTRAVGLGPLGVRGQEAFGHPGRRGIRPQRALGLARGVALPADA